MHTFNPPIEPRQICVMWQPNRTLLTAGAAPARHRGGGVPELATREAEDHALAVSSSSDSPPGFDRPGAGWKWSREVGVGQRVAGGDGVGVGAGEDALDGELELLARQRPRDRRHHLDPVGHVARRQLGGERPADARRQLVVEHGAGTQRDEQDQLAEARRGDAPGGGIVLDVHHERIGDLVEALDHRIEIARAEAHAAAVERGVGAPGDDARAVVGERDPVAVAPHAGEVLEVGGAVPRAVGVVPEARPASRASAR